MQEIKKNVLGFFLIFFEKLTNKPKVSPQSRDVAIMDFLGTIIVRSFTQLEKGDK